MQINKRAIAAIAAAIGLYLQAEVQSAASGVSAISRAQESPRAAFSPWAMAGRQAMMEMRQFYQMRLVR